MNTPREELRRAALVLQEQGATHISLWHPQGWKAPRGFPRRELLCTPTQGGSTVSVRLDKLIAWCQQ